MPKGGDWGHTLLLRGSALEDCVLLLRGKLGTVLGGGHPKQGGLGIGGVSGPCHFSVYHLSALLSCVNLSDPRFHCNRFRTTRDAAVSTFPFLPNREEAVLIAGEVVGKGRTRGVGGWKNGPASPGLALGGKLALEVEALS